LLDHLNQRRGYEEARSTGDGVSILVLLDHLNQSTVTMGSAHTPGMFQSLFC